MDKRQFGSKYQLIKHYMTLAFKIEYGDLGGQFRSHLKGSGLELKEVRPLESGEDARRIDWKTTARTGRPHVRLFHAERALRLMLLIDNNGSLALNYGRERSLKAELALMAAFVLGWAALKNGDNVGWFFNAAKPFFGPFSHSEAAFWQGIGRAEEILLRPEADLNYLPLPDFLSAAAKAANRETTMVIISDFLAISDNNYDKWLKTLKTIALKKELLALSVTDPLEKSLPDRGLLWLKNPSTGHEVLFDSSSGELQKEYAARARRREVHLERLFKEAGVPYQNLSAAQDPAAVIMNLLRLKAGH